MKFLLDEGVPISVGHVLAKASHEVIFFNDSGLAKSSADQVVCAAAEAGGAILIAADHDMKRLAKGHGITPARFKSMGLVRFECPKTMAVDRIGAALSIIEHEGMIVETGACKRLFVTIGEQIIRIHR